MLSPCHPNPFNKTTDIGYTLREANRVKIEVYKVLGHQVETLVDCEQQPGMYRIQWDASSAASGIYFYRIQAGEFVQKKKMLLLK